jgi:hypothetical protein
MNSLGIYFGPQLISIVEIKGNKTVNYVQVSEASLSSEDELHDKVPVSVKLVTLLKDEIKRNNIEANEAVVSISGKDLIVRTFEMPVLPRQELNSAVFFEVKKYIPFKIEELISDFQFKLDKTIQKTRVLFVGIKKEALNNYINIFSQLGIKIKSIEYSAFSILRLLKLANIKEKGIIAVVNIDNSKDDEANFVVLDSGFPLFSRDISLIGGYEEPVKAEETQQTVIMERLKREIQISLDYYDRKFPGKNIIKVFFITNPGFRSDLNGFTKELGLEVNFIDINKYLDKQVHFSLPFVKGYSSALSKINIEVKIDLLSAKERTVKSAGTEVSKPLALFMRFRSDLIALAACSILILFVLGSGFLRIIPLENELNNLINTRPETSIVPGELADKDLASISSSYKKKVTAMDNIIKSRLYLTPFLDVIPRVLPKGLRLVELSYKSQEDKQELNLKGIAYLGNKEKETEQVNTFISSLKDSQVFSKNFKDISVTTIEHKQIGKINMTNYAISCQETKKGK